MTGRVVPISRLNDIQRSLNSWFNEQDHGGLGNLPAAPRVFPALNIRDDGEALHIEAETPGFKMEDLDVSVLGAELTVKGRREHEIAEGVAYHRHERFTGEFSRTVTLPVEVEADRVSATLKEGVLSITAPKARAALPRKIEVKGA